MIGLPIKAIWFDYYGTLVDIGKPFEAIRRWFGENHAGLDERTLRALFMRFSKQRASLLTGEAFIPGYEILSRSYEIACRTYDITPYPHAFDEFVFQLFATAPAYSDACGEIARLRRNYHVGLITNADIQMLEANIQRNGFTFDRVICSEQAKCLKPGVGIFAAAASEMESGNVSYSQMLMVGDSMVEDIVPAQELGMHAIRIDRSAEAPMRWPAQIHSLKELRYYV